MGTPDRAGLLRRLELFERFSDARLADLAARLEPVALADGAQVFAEGSAGDGLYLVASGRVRVSKKLATGQEKDIASLGPGDCLGEMALLEELPRSASARASGDAELLKLKRDDLRSWLSTDAASAMDFFAALVHVQSRRLRRTSAELTLLSDLSSLLIEPAAGAADLLGRALGRVVPHLDGEWSACAFAYNLYNEEMDPAGTAGPAAFGPEAARVPPARAPELSWEDGRTLALVLRAPSRLLATVRLRAVEEPDAGRRAETERTMSAVSRLLCSALENIEARAEEALRRRLQESSDAAGI